MQAMNGATMTTRNAARTKGARLADDLVGALPDDPQSRSWALDAVRAIVNREARQAATELHVLAIGEGECPAPRCDIHGYGTDRKGA